ncbi:MAG: NAD-dependent epimerase/dehydratase family protein [Rhodanobacteraceae bacterium]|nr:NAD-dependent epimerase/dehydratase family protein [Rhodanobacteraceae bacterium]
MLLAAGHEIVVLDNLCNAPAESLRRVQEISGRALRFVEGDVAQRRRALARAFRGGIDAVVHFAALKAVGESCRTTGALLRPQYQAARHRAVASECANYRTRWLVFSSSDAVYGRPRASMPVDGEMPLIYRSACDFFSGRWRA